MTGSRLAPYLPKERREDTFDIPLMLERFAANIREGRIDVETLVLCGSGAHENIRVWHFGVGSERTARAILADGLALMQVAILEKCGMDDGPSDTETV